MSTHAYRVGKRRMAQWLHLPTTTNVSEIKLKWCAAGLTWPEGGPAGFYSNNIDPKTDHVVVKPA